ncbi:hypothetical protein SKAU_G00251620 [Synaphobranchus kaupii]|uniref:Uncharacterized protein n=1 Tax=Synaphobranchus kaupii TaxID=118154 RepID=A0A9Q1IRY7_SYNKA|nr:hypothetical protein SKAU_G00251620 [Synaphobranchus kaupii]
MRLGPPPQHSLRRLGQSAVVNNREVNYRKHPEGPENREQSPARSYPHLLRPSQFCWPATPTPAQHDHLTGCGREAEFPSPGLSSSSYSGNGTEKPNLQQPKAVANLAQTYSTSIATISKGSLTSLGITMD